MIKDSRDRSYCVLDVVFMVRRSGMSSAILLLRNVLCCKYVLSIVRLVINSKWKYEEYLSQIYLELVKANIPPTVPELL